VGGDAIDREHDPICAECGKAIPPLADKMTIQGVTYHMKCWDKKDRGRK
jgi:hypothetical protein